jgi:hypothetical protein
MDAGERDKRDQIESFQKAVAIVTAWMNDDDEDRIELVNRLVQTYAAEGGVERVLEGLLSLATALAVELRKARPQYHTEEEVLQRLSAYYEAHWGE